MKIISYTVLLMFESKPFNQMDNSLIVDFLRSRQYLDKSGSGVRFPQNTYIGIEKQMVLDWESEKDGAAKLKQRLYGILRRIKNLEPTPMVIFLMISPEEKTLTFVPRLKAKK
ncbi:hypothetical protein [Enterobacter hormaechei]|uniref:hypothetical protein n=1 Tax=Enterobacter hormaechei TaxID=158836 RepID=UPI00223756E3|nr:hypothetical protein [Enterobacter hormaechei]MCW4909117.1 hypothetical protein [Enterobacter hormaechei subsp. xiangfangensis]